MSKFIEGQDRSQGTLFPERLDDYVEEDSPVRVIDVFIDDLDISGLGFRTELAATGRPRDHPKTMLKLYVYGYLNRVQSSRRLEREAQRNVELMWLTGRLAPDFKTIADFRRADIERGGQGAPLAPAFHEWLLRREGTTRIVLNIGGIANITVLFGDDRPTIGFDTGPGNVVMDAWHRRHRDGPFDRDGGWARSGEIDDICGFVLRHKPGQPLPTLLKGAKHTQIRACYRG